MLADLDLQTLARMDGPERAFLTLYLSGPDAVSGLAYRFATIRALLADEGCDVAREPCVASGRPDHGRARLAGVQVAQAVERADVVRVVREHLPVLPDGGIDPPLGDVLLGRLDDPFALDRHETTSPPSERPPEGSCPPLRFDPAPLQACSSRSWMRAALPRSPRR